MTVLYVLLGFWLLLGLYTYIGYPLLLLALGALRRRNVPGAPEQWPPVSITVPMHNEEEEAAELLESLLAIDYPADRRQILIVSDASTDRTDEIVRSFADRGVELLRLPQRKGKTAVEAAAAPHLRGEIVINTDASIRIHPGAVKQLVARFADREVGVASGRDISVARVGEHVNPGESKYVGYEMWVRSLETRVFGIVGSSGCLYAIRSELHRTPLPEGLSRDFSSALIARLRGYRAVSVDEAICYVPRTDAMEKEYSRKVRTITRGLQTLWYFRRLLNPFAAGLFGVFLISHKLCRWLTAWVTALALAAVIGVALLEGAPLVRAAAAVTLTLALLGPVLLRSAAVRAVPGLGALLFLFAGNTAAVHALFRTLGGRGDPIWEPTRRTAAVAASKPGA
jgi:cellulose synthase/poly-beta-1,6-N-acetylglucosamine synthase-like glycosyltransferase